MYAGAFAGNAPFIRARNKTPGLTAMDVGVPLAVTRVRRP